MRERVKKNFTNNARRKRKKNENFEKMKKKLDIAVVRNDGNKIIPEVKNKNPHFENLSIHRNTVQTKRIVRFPGSNTKATEHNFDNKNQEIKHSADVVWNIPYGSKIGDMQCYIDAQKYSLKERNEEIMKIISSYLVDNVDNDISTSKNNICMKQNVIQKSLKFENEYYQHIPPPEKDVPYSLEVKGNMSLCSEDESPIYTYYPHRLN